jgi:hypothetical protein
MYHLPQPGHVRLDVYNVAGQKVATLVDGRQDAGDHDIQFNAGGMASGVYFMRLSHTSGTVSLKTILLR